MIRIEPWTSYLVYLYSVLRMLFRPRSEDDSYRPYRRVLPPLNRPKSSILGSMLRRLDKAIRISYLISQISDSEDNSSPGIMFITACLIV